MLHRMLDVDKLLRTSVDIKKAHKLMACGLFRSPWTFPDFNLVEMAGFEPASANPPLEDLHA